MDNGVRKEGVERHQRWLHPKQLPYLWVGLLCLLTAPAVGMGVLAYFLFTRLLRLFGGRDRSLNA